MSKSGGSAPPTINILIVDDLAQVREELADVLQLTADFNVIGTAENGRKAIELAAQLSPDIVLMDLEMPGMDGLAAAQQIISRQLARSVIILSIHSRRRNSQRAQEVGIAAYVEKGEGIDTLITTLRQVWRKSSTMKEKVDS
ncbi:MAG: response regulator transcription factor [Chloroflexota bacterium]